MRKLSLVLVSSWRYQSCRTSSSDAGTEWQVLGKHTSESPPHPGLLLIDARIAAATSPGKHFIFVKPFAKLIYFFIIYLIIINLKNINYKGLIAKSSSSFLQTGIWISAHLPHPTVISGL